LPVSKLPARMFREKRILIIYIKSNKSHYKTIVLLQEKSMAKERIKANVPIEAIAAQLRKDEKFLQGVGLYAVYQSSIETKSRRTAKHVQYEPQVLCKIGCTNSTLEESTP
jgi:hypothetical protein